MKSSHGLVHQYVTSKEEEEKKEEACDVPLEIKNKNIYFNIHMSVLSTRRHTRAIDKEKVPLQQCGLGQGHGGLFLCFHSPSHLWESRGDLRNMIWHNSSV